MIASTLILKRPAEIELMAQAGALLEKVHQEVAKAIKPGVTTAELDKIAHEKIVSFGAKPAFLGYKGFPATLNTSINDEIIHGIPSKRTLKDSDIITIDCGLIYKGFVADAARTYALGQVSDEAKRLIAVATEALKAGIAAAQPGNRLGDISHAIQRTAERAGFWVIREFVGHGIGRAMHEKPDVPNWGNPGKGPMLKPGLVLAIEPMIAARKTGVEILEDGWTAVTKDGSLAVQVEHTVAVTEQGPRILTC